MSLSEYRQLYLEADCLFSQDQVTNIIERLGVEISLEIASNHPLVIPIMSGAMVFAGQLLPKLDFPLQLDYLHASRYRGKTTGTDYLEWLAKPRTSMKDRTILLVDDILDEGPTLKAIVAYCQEMGAERVLSAVLVKKIHQRNIGMDADFVGVEIEDRYLFGAGMDYKEYGRNAPGIYAIKEDRGNI